MVNAPAGANRRRVQRATGHSAPPSHQATRPRPSPPGIAGAFLQSAGAARPTLTFRWLDIEDEADALGDLDVETFPTLVIGGRDGAVRFAGPVLPQPGQIARLLQSLGL